MSGYQFTPGCCCGCVDESGLTPTKVLLWDRTPDVSAAMGGLNAVRNVYTSLGITAEAYSTLPFAQIPTDVNGLLFNYRLIIFLMAEADPTWWPLISSGSWTGRIHFSGEYNIFSATRNYVNSKTGLHGMTIASDITGSLGCNGESNASSPHQLTDEVDALIGNTSASVSGGNTLFTNSILSLPMTQQNKPSGIDWVVSGESSHLADHCPTAAALNKQFLCNLWRKPL